MTQVPVLATDPATQTQAPSVALIQVSDVVNPPQEAGAEIHAVGLARELLVHDETYPLHPASVNGADGLFVHDLASQALPDEFLAQAALYA